MKKATKKKATVKKAPKAAKPKPAAASTPKGTSKPAVNKQPQVKQDAAVANGMFLYVDDAWSLRYFDKDDLHFLEREVFG
jgi:hypothetical protein